MRSKETHTEIVESYFPTQPFLLWRSVDRRVTTQNKGWLIKKGEVYKN